MINQAIFWKTARDSASLLIAASIGIILFTILFVWAMLDMGKELMQFVSQFGFLKKIFEVGFGIDVSGEVSLRVLFSVCFTHAVVLTLAWAVIIATTSRVTAGEVEKGTADLLFTLPVTRAEVYFSTSLVWVISTLILSMCPVAGLWLGIHLFETGEVIAIKQYLKPAINFQFLLLAIGGISCLASSLIDRRGPAVATVIGILLASTVLNFIEPFIAGIKKIRFLGLLNYFRPVEVVRAEQWPVFEMVVLFLLGFICWSIGLFVFCRKDIPTA